MLLPLRKLFAHWCPKLVTCLLRIQLNQQRLVPTGPLARHLVKLVVQLLCGGDVDLLQLERMLLGDVDATLQLGSLLLVPCPFLQWQFEQKPQYRASSMKARELSFFLRTNKVYKAMVTADVVCLVEMSDGAAANHLSRTAHLLRSHEFLLHFTSRIAQFLLSCGITCKQCPISYVTITIMSEQWRYTSVASLNQMMQSNVRLRYAYSGFLHNFEYIFPDLTLPIINNTGYEQFTR